MWYVKMYMNTGFNLINVPDSPELLAQKTSKKFGVIDCLQRYFLPSITIRATEDQVIHGDFLKLYDDEDDSKYAYYVINSYTMTSGDTVVLDVAMEPLLTCGGIDNITILDGVTSRHHLAAGEDIPTEKDPLLIPKKIYIAPVAYYANGVVKYNDPNRSQDYALIIRSTLDPATLNNIATNIAEDQVIKPMVNIEATVDPQTQTVDSYTGTFVSSPVLKAHSNPEDATDVGFGHEGSGGTYSLFRDISDGSFYIRVDLGEETGHLSLSTLTKALIRLTQYGRDDIILDAYYVPKVLLDNSGSSYVTYGGFDKLLNMFKVDVTANVLFEDADVYSYKVLPDIGSLKPSDIHNKRAYFGEHFAYTFFSPDNNQSITIDPEEFYSSAIDYDETGSGTTYDPELAPKIKMSCDFRPGGSITFSMHVRQKWQFGLPAWTSNTSPYNISTDTWDTAALNISAVNGLAQKVKNYAMSSQNKDAAVEMDIQNQIENKRRGLRAVNPFNQISASINQLYNEEMYNLQGNRTGNMIGAKIGAESGNEYAKMRYDRMLQRETEDMEFINSLIPKTQVVSKMGGSSITNGMGLVVFRNYINSEDLQKFDQILNKYGCKHTTTLTHDMLTNRPLFNYIETNGVSIKCSTVPKAVRDELAAAFNTGLRIWHVKNVDVNAWNDPVEEES